MSVVHGSGNVFADLCLPDAAERQNKALLAMHIAKAIKDRGWTQAEAAERMGLSQPDVSKIVKGRLAGFAIERLFDCLNALNTDVEIRLKDSGDMLGKTSVVCDQLTAKAAR